MLVPTALVFLEQDDVSLQLSVSGSCTPGSEARLHFLLDLEGRGVLLGMRQPPTAVLVHGLQEPYD